MGIALGIRHVQGLFLLPITMDRDWSREDFATAMAIQNLTWGIAQPLAGMVADRFGSPRVILGGLVLYAIGLVGLALASSVGSFILSAGICIGSRRRAQRSGLSMPVSIALCPWSGGAGRSVSPGRSVDWANSLSFPLPRC